MTTTAEDDQNIEAILHAGLREDDLLSFEQISPSGLHCLWSAKIQVTEPMTINPPKRAQYLYFHGLGPTMMSALAMAVKAYKDGGQDRD